MGIFELPPLGDITVDIYPTRRLAVFVQERGAVAVTMTPLAPASPGILKDSGSGVTASPLFKNISGSLILSDTVVSRGVERE